MPCIPLCTHKRSVLSSCCVRPAHTCARTSTVLPRWNLGTWAVYFLSCAVCSAPKSTCMMQPLSAPPAQVPRCPGAQVANATIAYRWGRAALHSENSRNRESDARQQVRSFPCRLDDRRRLSTLLFRCRSSGPPGISAVFSPFLTCECCSSAHFMIFCPAHPPLPRCGVQ